MPGSEDGYVDSRPLVSPLHFTWRLQEATPLGRALLWEPLPASSPLCARPVGGAPVERPEGLLWPVRSSACAPVSLMAPPTS